MSMHVPPLFWLSLASAAEGRPGPQAGGASLQSRRGLRSSGSKWAARWLQFRRCNPGKPRGFLLCRGLPLRVS